jgi:hypothetical protein
MLIRADPKTNRPITTASQSSFNRAFSAIGSDTFTATTFDFPDPMLKKTAATIRTRPPRAEKPASIQGNVRVKEA